MTATSTSRAFRFRGQTRSGTSCGGTFQSDDLVAWLENEYSHRRWARLTILVGDVEVGGICKHLDTGRLIWWAENTKSSDG